MITVLPAGWLTTVDAQDALAALRPELDGADVDRRAAVVVPEIVAALVARELVAVFLVGEAFQEFEVPTHCYDSIDADLAIFMARSTGLSLSREDKKRLDGAPLCLRRVEWDKWLTARKRKIAAPADPTASEDSLVKLLCEESSLRERQGKPRNRDALRLFAKTEFGVTAAHAQELVEKMPSGFRAHGGRPPKLRNPGRK